MRVEAVPALHSGFRPPLGPTAPALGFVSAARATVYFAGDTDLFEGMADLGGRSTSRCCRSGAGARPSVAGCTWTRSAPPSRCGAIRPRAAVPIHWGTYWPHAMGRVYPERRVEPPAAFAEYAAELAPDVRVLLTEVGTDGRVARPDRLADWAAMTAPPPVPRSDRPTTPGLRPACAA